MRSFAVWSLLVVGCGGRGAGMAGDPCGPARSCAAGLVCQANVCTPVCPDMAMGNGWVQQPSGTTNDLRAVWGASASSVWAVGDNGTAVFYDGKTWQVQAVPLFRTQAVNLAAVHGSSASNVFALGSVPSTAGITVLFTFVKQQWTMVTSFAEFGEPTGLYVTGDDRGDIYVTTRREDGTFLHRINGTARTQLASTEMPTGAIACTYQGKPSTGVWALQAQPNQPAAAVFVADCQTWQWDGAQSAIVLRNPNPVLSNNLWGLGTVGDLSVSVSLFGVESAPTGGNSDLSVWLNAAWSTIDTKLGGWTGGVSGTATNRVVVTGNDANAAYVLTYDGNGVLQEQMPAGVSGLLGIWAAPTNEIFAVGAKGAIVFKQP